MPSTTGSPAPASPPADANFPVPGGMIETAENLRAEFDISREDQDALAVQSHQRAVAAQRIGDASPRRSSR